MGHTRAPQVVPPPGTLETPYGQVMSERRGRGGAQRRRDGLERRGESIHYGKGFIFLATQCLKHVSTFTWIFETLYE